MTKLETVLKYESGDKIPGEYVDTVCSRCSAKIKRITGEDLFNPKARDMKILSSIMAYDGKIMLTWIHVCVDCQKEFMLFIDTFLKNKRIKKRGKAKGSPVTVRRSTARTTKV